MLARLTSPEQVQAIYDEFMQEDNWLWWIEGAYPSYGKFENWMRNCDQDAIGLFTNYIKTADDSYRLLGFSRFSRTDLTHGFTYLTVWILPSLRKQRGLTPYGMIAASDALNFVYKNFPLRKVYQNIIEGNAASLRPLQKICQYEGMLRDHYFFDGEYRNLLTFSITRDTWNEFYSRYSRKIDAFL